MTDEECKALLPCPFCGSDAKRMVDFQAAGFTWWMVECQNSSCDAMGPAFSTEAEAIAGWDTRADGKRIAELEEALRNIQIEADREQGHWQHLKRVIAVNARKALGDKV